jgi:hypothetical protein
LIVNCVLVTLLIQIVPTLLVGSSPPVTVILPSGGVRLHPCETTTEVLPLAIVARPMASLMYPPLSRMRAPPVVSLISAVAPLVSSALDTIVHDAPEALTPYRADAPSTRFAVNVT